VLPYFSGGVSGCPCFICQTVCFTGGFSLVDALTFQERNGPLVRGSGIVPLVVGVVLGLVLIICLIAVAIVIWKYKRKSDGM